MMEYDTKNKYSPSNFYSATKKSFETMLEFYKNNFQKCKFYNIKIFETYNYNDNRKKILPTLINCYKNKSTFKLINKKLKLNFISIKDLLKFIENIIRGKVLVGNYLIRSKKNTNIFNFK